MTDYNGRVEYDGFELGFVGHKWSFKGAKSKIDSEMILSLRMVIGVKWTAVLREILNVEFQRENLEPLTDEEFDWLITDYDNKHPKEK